MHDDSDFLYESPEEQIAFKILQDKTNKVINRSNVQSLDESLQDNIRLDPLITLSIVRKISNLHDDSTVFTTILLS